MRSDDVSNMRQIDSRQQAIVSTRQGLPDNVRHAHQGADVKPTNPKDAVGIAKAPFSPVSAYVMAELGVAMMEGARKYGRHNYRVIGVRASVYYDATLRHMVAWWEGENLDPDSGLSHVTKAIASLCVLRDAMLLGKFVDDRPPPLPAGWLNDLNAKAKALIEKYPDARPAHIALDSA
jgi:hypothetical protein